jgi:hypothetical protein
MNHKPKHRREQCFADWCQILAPQGLNLDEECTTWITRVMSAPEMRGVTSLQELMEALRLRRTKLRWADPIRWHRLRMVAKVMWQQWKAEGP